MHRFNLAAAQILLGLEQIDDNVESHCLAIITNCYEITKSVPTYAEFAEAFNKLLYVSLVLIDCEKLVLTDFGHDIINKARSRTNADARSEELLELVYKVLSGYKLKSMCNRTVWSEAQYHEVVDAIANS